MNQFHESTKGEIWKDQAIAPTAPWSGKRSVRRDSSEDSDDPEQVRQILQHSRTQTAKLEIGGKCGVNRCCYSRAGRVMSRFLTFVATWKTSPERMDGVSICVLDDSRVLISSVRP